MKDYFTLPQLGGKMDPDEFEQWLAAFHSDDNRSHIVFPGMLYIDSPTNQQFPILTRSEAESLLHTETPKTTSA